MAKPKAATNSIKVIHRGGKPTSALPAGYATLLTDLKARVRAAQLRAAVAVNRELIALYWDIGRVVVEQQKQHKWGDGVIDRLSRDLAKEFPQMAGFSRFNLYRMRTFFLAYSGADAIVAQPVLQLPGEAKRQQPVGESSPQILSQVVRELPGQKLSSPVAESSTIPPESIASFQRSAEHQPRGSVLDCGGKRSATPLSHARRVEYFPTVSCVRKRCRRCALPPQSKTSREFAP